MHYVHSENKSGEWQEELSDDGWYNSEIKDDRCH